MRFWTTLVAAFLAVFPGGLAGMVWGPLGTIVFVVAWAVLWPVCDRFFPPLDRRGDTRWWLD